MTALLGVLSSARKAPPVFVGSRSPALSAASVGTVIKAMTYDGNAVDLSGFDTSDNTIDYHSDFASSNIDKHDTPQQQQLQQLLL